MKEYRFAIFDTEIGHCGVVWSDAGLAAVALPESNHERTRDQLLRRFSGSTQAPPTAEAQSTIDGIAALLRGEHNDLRWVALDLEGLPPFDRDVYRAARAIAPSQTLTYGEIAEQIGRPGCAQAVGQALARNPWPIVVPCHRVLAAGGKIGGFSARGGVATKRRLLAIEGFHESSTLALFDAL
ncbi:MAG TPA: methylated-DNA--[protein]-cysteine S-methyltransferase [Solirubrobacteraceae bacterium]|jgi:methylated-DNA-[protein]-cysteine S-methyltransferase